MLIFLFSGSILKLEKAEVKQELTWVFCGLNIVSRFFLLLRGHKKIKQWPWYMNLRKAVTGYLKEEAGYLHL
jgi:hypothetical protein